MTPQVDIALATYNGARFLRPLLQSLQDQQGVDLRVIASDDGSTDDTMALLRKVGQVGQGFPIAMAPANPRGNVLRNFENALLFTEAPYVALSDQDDVWDPRKLEVLLARACAIEADQGSGMPVLVFCDLEIADEDLRTISPSFFRSTLKSRGARRFRDFVLGNHVPGCAMLVNRALLEKALPFPEVDIHDHWLIQVAALFGVVAYVDRPLIKYRQHGSNAVGLGAAGRGRLARIASLITSAPQQLIGRRRRWARQAQAVRRNMAALKERYGTGALRAEDAALIDAVVKGDRQGIRHGLRGALSGERKLDYWGLLIALSRAPTP